MRKRGGGERDYISVILINLPPPPPPVLTVGDDYNYLDYITIMIHTCIMHTYIHT